MPVQLPEEVQADIETYDTRGQMECHVRHTLRSTSRLTWVLIVSSLAYGATGVHKDVDVLCKGGFPFPAASGSIATGIGLFLQEYRRRKGHKSALRELAANDPQAFIEMMCAFQPPDDEDVSTTTLVDLTTDILETLPEYQMHMDAVLADEGREEC